MSVIQSIQVLPEWFPDKVTERQMADILCTTDRALEARRLRNQIPEGVWKRVQGRIYYSRERYEQWQESLWNSPEESKKGTACSVSASPGKENAVPKPSHTPRRKQAMRQQPVCVIK